MSKARKVKVYGGACHAGFLDTEFTDFNDCDLIAIGMVFQTGAINIRPPIAAVSARSLLPIAK